MKKIIAISVMFALVAGAVFADVSLGGGFGYKAELAAGDNGKVWDGKADDAGKPVGYANPVTSTIGATEGKVDFNFSGDNYGGRVRLFAFTQKGWWQSYAGGGAPFAFAWWKPVDLFQFQLGHNPDGNWGAAQITGWGFNASAQDFVAVDNDSNGNTGKISIVDGTGNVSGSTRTRTWKAARAYGFYPGYSNVGALLSFYPADIFTVNIALPFSSNHSDATRETADVFKTVHANFVVKVGDVGTARLSYIGGLGTKTTKKTTKETEKSYNDAGDIYASFYLTAIENLAVDFGVGFGLAYKKLYTDDMGTPSVTTDDVSWAYTYNPGIQVGLGARYTVSDDFGVKVRIGAKLLQEESIPANAEAGFKADTYTYPTEIGIGILPYYKLGGPTVYFNAGFGMSLANETGEKNLTDWYVNPYVQVPSGGLTFWAGIKLLGDTILTGQYGASTSWAIPIGISVGF